MSLRPAILIVVLAFAMTNATRAWSAAGTDHVARPGERISPEVVAHYEWPEGSVELVNDPLRANGWHPWFSELPNDTIYFEMNVRDARDVQHLIDQMKKVKTLKRRIALHPGREANIVSYTKFVKAGNEIGAVFQIGSQARLDQWYEHLAEVRPGVKVFGVHEYEKAPEAQPPTLILYVQHPTIDLDKLEIPTTIQVTTDIDLHFRKDDANRELIARLEQFAARHRARQEAARKASKAPLPE